MLDDGELWRGDGGLLRRDGARSWSDRDLLAGDRGLLSGDRGLLWDDLGPLLDDGFPSWRDRDLSRGDGEPLPADGDPFLRFLSPATLFLPRIWNFPEFTSMKNILNRGFGDLSDDAFVTKVNFILSELSGNADFPATDPTLPAVRAALDALIAALALANPTARAAAVAATRKTLEQMLDDLADNLEETAQMDPVKLATTGFDLHKTTQQTGAAPGTPQNVRLKLTGNTGEAQLLFDASDRAKGYEVQTTTDPVNGPWAPYDSFSSVRGIVLKGFPRAKDIWVRVRALGPNNTKSGWSNAASILIN